ncbi:hypothetical protein H8356DRAFT_1334826 [Neocallimastix lanati (nom. inval.)]|nr:hypothetical protein H8356DRAFT_1334826 [Neocallimastix sp. JGI-2020a]
MVNKFIEAANKVGDKVHARAQHSTALIISRNFLMKSMLHFNGMKKVLYLFQKKEMISPMMWTVFPGVLITAFCDSDDNRWLSFLKWLLVRRVKTGILEDCRK